MSAQTPSGDLLQRTLDAAKRDVQTVTPEGATDRQAARRDGHPSLPDTRR